MIIFGTRNRTKNIGQGKFNCPHCMKERNFVRKEAKPHFSLYFVPLFPIGQAQEYIECEVCGRSYAPDVLNFKPSKPQTDVARVLNTLKGQLERGLSVEYIVAGLTGEGYERDVAENMVNMAIGTGRKTCPKCELTFAPSVEKCPDDGSLLEKL